MPTDLPLKPDGWDAVSELMEQVRASREESGRFLAAWFGDVELLLTEFAQEEAHWRGECEQARRNQDERAAALEERQRQLAAAQAGLESARSAIDVSRADRDEPPWREALDQMRQEWAVLRESMPRRDESPWHETHETLEQMRQEWKTLRESLPGLDADADRWATILGDLARTRDELAEARGEIHRLAGPIESMAEDVPVRRTSEELQAEVDAMQAERQLLEAELENVRRRAEQLNNALDEQRRVAAEHEAYWREESRRQCSILERMTAQWALALSVGSAEEAPSKGQGAAPPNAAAGRRQSEGAAVANNAALESVRAQFELLQKEAARRRRDHSESS